MDWHNIPSLAALRAFEAAARLGSYSAAARELNVTHAAVAQHLRKLDDHFGRPLMERAGQGMQATPTGKPLADSLSRAFTIIQTGVTDALQDDTAQRVRLTLTPSFASVWLMPRMGAFWAAHPDIQIEILPSTRRVDLRSEGIDLAIRYGLGDWAGLESQPLVAANHVVVAAPSLVKGRRFSNITDLQNEHWIMESVSQEAYTWASTQGVDFETARVTRFGTNDLVLNAIMTGAGVSVIPKALVERDIAEGRLKCLFEQAEDGRAYHLLTRPDRVSAPVQTFARWLLRTAKAPSL